MFWFAETSGLLPDPFASDNDRIIGNHLRFEPRSILGLRLYGDESPKRLPARKSTGNPPEIRIPAIEWNG